MRVLKMLCCAAAMTTMLAPTARADEWNKKTILTFSGPVQIPGTTLAAGSYVFKLADIPGNRHVVQVFDKDEKKIYATLLAIPNDRLEPADKPVILFSERQAGSPQAVKVWYYPGDRIGDEFVYPKSQAMRIAKETHQKVLAYNNEGSNSNTAGEVPESMKSAELGYFDENGNWQPTNEKVAVNNDRPAASQTTAAQTTADRDRAAGNTAANTTTSDRASSTTSSDRSNRVAENRSRSTTAATGTSGQSTARSSRRQLPRTASGLALYELLSGLSLAGGFLVRSLRK
jgi:hypothetical protein